MTISAAPQAHPATGVQGDVRQQMRSTVLPAALLWTERRSLILVEVCRSGVLAGQGAGEGRGYLAWCERGRRSCTAIRAFPADGGVVGDSHVAAAGMVRVGGIDLGVQVIGDIVVLKYCQVDGHAVSGQRPAHHAFERQA